MSTTILPDQATALVQLLADTQAVACEVADDEHWSLRVATYHAAGEDRAPSTPPAEARWWSVSVAGSVREIAPTPERVAA